jgi:RNA polymerase sigma-70 factor (ECF subfamily)
MIFRLIREDNLKYREVAELLGISPKTVEAQIGIAMKKLSEALQRANCTTALPVLRSVS